MMEVPTKAEPSVTDMHKKITECESFIKTGETPILNASQYIEADQIYIAAGCSIYRTSIINATNLKFDEDLKLGEDQLFIYIIYLNASLA